MPELSDEQRKALEEQKKQCPFCQIIEGKIPAKKIYEDDKVVALLDINPATKGHTLVMPKEHYPIMPLIPPEIFAHLFKIVRDISKTLKKSLLMTGTNVFVANGAVAGQQSGHFMVHIIPREEGDSFKGIKLKEGKVDEAKIKELEGMLSHNLPLMLRDFYKKHPIEGKEAPAAPKLDKEKVIEIIGQNPQLVELIKKDPKQVRDAIPSNDQLKMLFSNVKFEEIVEHFTGIKEAEFEDIEDEVDKETKKESKDKKESKKKVKKKSIKKVKKKKSKKTIEDEIEEDSDEEPEEDNDEDTEDVDDIEKEENNEESETTNDEEDDDDDSEEPEDDDSEETKKEEDPEEASLDDIARLFA